MFVCVEVFHCFLEKVVALDIDDGNWFSISSSEVLGDLRSPEVSRDKAFSLLETNGSSMPEGV